MSGRVSRTSPALRRRWDGRRRAISTPCAPMHGGGRRWAAATEPGGVVIRATSRPNDYASDTGSARDLLETRLTAVAGELRGEPRARELVGLPATHVIRRAGHAAAGGEVLDEVLGAGDAAAHEPVLGLEVIARLRGRVFGAVANERARRRGDVLEQMIDLVPRGVLRRRGSGTRRSECASRGSGEKNVAEAGCGHRRLLREVGACPTGARTYGS